MDAFEAQGILKISTKEMEDRLWMQTDDSPTSLPAEDFDSIGAPQLQMRACDNSLMSQVAALTHTRRLLINSRPPVNHTVRAAALTNIFDFYFTLTAATLGTDGCPPPPPPHFMSSSKNTLKGNNTVAVFLRIIFSLHTQWRSAIKTLTSLNLRNSSSFWT